MKHDFVLSREVHEIFSAKPGWFVRYGIIICVLNIIAMLLISWLVKFPDVIIVDGELTIQPAQVTPDSTGYFAEIIIPQHKSGKLIAGQDITLKFGNYPFQQSGSVAGIIRNVSQDAADSTSRVKVFLPGGLKTNERKTIEYRRGVSVQAEIVVGQKRLLQILVGNRVSNLNP